MRQIFFRRRRAMYLDVSGTEMFATRAKCSGIIINQAVRARFDTGCHPLFTIIASMNLNEVNTQWTEDRILELVRKLRNDLIKDFLDERHLKAYLSNQFRVNELSNIKIEFIKKDLKELLISPVNTVHYQALIEQIRETDTAGITETNEPLFYKELELIFKRYMFN